MRRIEDTLRARIEGVLREYPRKGCKEDPKENLQENNPLIQANVWVFYYQIASKASSLTLNFRNFSPIRNFRVLLILRFPLLSYDICLFLPFA